MKQTIISVKKLFKIYRLYAKPIDRLKETLNLRKKKYYKDYYVLDNISFEINSGDNIGIIGANGAGKSTLLKIITGVLSPTTGVVNVNGKVSALLELGTGFNPDYTGMENIHLVGTMMGFTEDEVNKKVQLILDFADIGDFIYQPVKTYSSGMFARLAFGVAINVEPQILIVDEVLSVGDIRFQIKCMNKMKEMIKGGSTVLFVSHDIGAIRRFCNKTLWLDKGRLINFGKTNEIVDEYLEFLNYGEIIEKKETEGIREEVEEFTPKDVVVEIIGFTIYNEKSDAVDEFNSNDCIDIEVVYDVYDIKIQNIGLGIIIRGIDDAYISGVYTLLEHIELPWTYGRNKMTLECPHGIMAISGHYYFDISIYRQNSTDQTSLVTMVKEFAIKANYEGEGRYVVPHKWNVSISKENAHEEDSVY